jgi:hypothetical protein
MTDIHSCSYYCDQPECVKAQRDELRDKLAKPEQELMIRGDIRDGLVDNDAQPEQEDGCPVCGSDVHDRDALDKAEREIERLTALIAQPEQEPAAWLTQARCLVPASEFTKAEATLFGWQALSTTPPAAQRTWVGLTHEQAKAFVAKYGNDPLNLVFQAEAVMKEKNDR